MTQLRMIARDYDLFTNALSSQLTSSPIPTVLRSGPIEWLHEQAVRGVDWDVALVVTDWLPELRRVRAIRPVTQDLHDFAPDDWPSDWVAPLRDLQKTPDGETWAMPYHQGPVMLLYRTDLFDSPKERQAYEDIYDTPLTPPTTWDEMVQVARFFTRPDDGLYGTIQAGYPDAHNNVYDFLTHLWSRGGKLLDDQNRPTFASDAGIEALTFLRDLIHKHRVVDPASLQWNSVDSGQRFAAGNAAFMVNWCGFASMSAPSDSPTHGRIACTAPPSGPAGPVSLNVFWATVISPNASPEAWQLVRHLASSHMDKMATQHGVAACRRSTWQDPIVQEQAPYFAELESVHKYARSLPSVLGLSELLEVLNTAVDDALNMRSTPKEALEDAQRTARSLEFRVG